MRLTVGKSQGFVIQGTGRELRVVAELPGASYREMEGVVRLPVNLSSWKTLRNVDFQDMCVKAEQHMLKLKHEYRSRRAQIRRATRRFKTTGDTDIPVPLKSIPMEHQVRAFGFCSSLPESALLMDMGTGKTLVAIAIAGARFLELEQLRVLVICPRAVKPVWPKELRKHAGYEYSVAVDEIPEGEGAQFWVTNYDRVKRELRRMIKWKPHLIILDESHRIKNRKAARTKAVLSLKSPFKLIMSGSPIGKCITEIWSQYKFLNPSVFGSFSEFKDNYLKMGGYMGYVVVGYKNQDEYADKLHSISFRVTKDECLDLPPLTYQRLYVESDRETRRIYKELELDFYTEVNGDEVTVDREITKQMKLRQVTGGLVKNDDDTLSHVSRIKLDALGEFLEDRRDDKTVIYFSFTHEIELVKTLCKKLKIKFISLQGSTPESDRSQFETRFQDDPSIEVALIQIQTGAEGMTLTAANVSLFYSPTFSFILYLQARDRINRIGQLRPMTIVFLIVEKTIDEWVVDVLECNRQLVDTFLEHKRTYSVGDTKMATKKPAAKAAPAKTTKKVEAAPAVEGFRAADLAAERNIEPAELRKQLRAIGATKPGAGWVWPSAEHKDVAKIRKELDAHVKALAAAPAKEKTKVAPAAETKKAPAKTASKKAAETVAAEEAAPKKTTRRVTKKAE